MVEYTKMPWPNLARMGIRDLPGIGPVLLAYADTGEVDPATGLSIYAPQITGGGSGGGGGGGSSGLGPSAIDEDESSLTNFDAAQEFLTLFDNSLETGISGSTVGQDRAIDTIFTRTKVLTRVLVRYRGSESGFSNTRVSLIFADGTTETVLDNSTIDSYTMMESVEFEPVACVGVRVEFIQNGNTNEAHITDLVLTDVSSVFDYFLEKVYNSTEELLLTGTKGGAGYVPYDALDSRMTELWRSYAVTDKKVSDVIDEASLGAGASVESSAIDLSEYKAGAITTSVTFGGSAIAGVTVTILSSPDGSSWDTEDYVSDAGPAYTAGGSTVQRTLNLDTVVKYIKVRVENDDGSNAQGAIKVTLTKNE